MSWVKSQFCDTSSCVEAMRVENEIWMRDSKDPDGPILKFPAREWSQFMADINKNKSDLADTP